MLLRAGLFLTMLAILAGTAVRFTLRDQTLLSSLIFYGTPLPVLVLGVSCLLWSACTLRRWRVGFRWLILLLLLGAIWIRSDWKFSARPVAGIPPEMVAAAALETDDSEDVSLLFWNVARRRNLEAAADFIRRKDPDLVGLVEVQGEPETWRAFWRKELPEHDVSVLGSNMFLLTKGTSGEATPHDLGGGSQVRQLEVRFHNRLYEILLVDIQANPFQPREQALRKLTELADRLSDRRLVIMGDFNLPTDSIHLHALRKRHLLAFEAAGRGYAPTWPIPLPLMQLDQIWTNFQVIPVECRHSWTWASDHEPVEAIIRPRRSVPD